MDADQPEQFSEEDEPQTEKPINFLPFDVQLQNIFCIEIVARRYPVDIARMPNINVSLEEAQVDLQSSLAQVTLHVRTISDDPPPFDISFKLLGLFKFSENYHEEEVRLFLEQGSLSILLPFARELLFSLCARLQVPPMMLTMVQLVPHPSIYQSSNEEDLNNK